MKDTGASMVICCSESNFLYVGQTEGTPMIRWINHIRNHHQGTRFDEQFLNQEMGEYGCAKFFKMPLKYIYFQYTDCPECSVRFQTCKESF